MLSMILSASFQRSNSLLKFSYFFVFRVFRATSSIILSFGMDINPAVPSGDIRSAVVSLARLLAVLLLG